MKLSLQRKVSLKTTFYQREKMIKQENLHISDEISLEQFQNLYRKYGNDIGQKEFARCFLDMSYDSCYKLLKGKIKGISILAREFILEQELLDIKKKVIEFYQLKPNQELDYKEICEMHVKFGGKLSLVIFAEEILNVTAHSIERLRTNEEGRAKILKPIEVPRKQIKEIQEKVVRQAGRHIHEEISLEELEKLYAEFGENIGIKLFATKVLQVSSRQINPLLKGKIKKSAIFSKYFVNPDDICKLRERVILEEGLHIGDSIDKSDFERLYQKYGGMLSEEIFAEEILDVTAVSVKNMKKGGNLIVLKNIEIPEEYIEEIRKKVISENNFEHKQFLEREKIEILYQKFGYILSEKQFVELILDTVETQNKRITILRNQKTTDFDELRKRIIKENHLHYDDRMEYFEFERLHKKYAPHTKEYIFAEKIFDLSVGAFSGIKSKKGEKFTYILLGEKLPSNEEIERIKQIVIRENKLHRKDEINYEKFCELHLKYGGIMPAYMFAERILDISKASLDKINPMDKRGRKRKKGTQKEKVQILLNTQMEDEKIEALKERVIAENQLYVAKEITLEEFEKMYGENEHILSRIEFAKEILGVNKQNLNKLKHGICQTVKVLIGVEKGQKRETRKNDFTEKEIELLREYLIQGMSEEEIATRFSVTLPFLRRNQKKIFKSGILSKKEILYGKIRYLWQQGYDISQIEQETSLPNEEIRSIISNISKEKQKREKQERKRECQQGIRKEELKKKSKRIVEKFDYTEKNVSIVKDYLDADKEIFEMEELNRETLDFLEKCISFIQGDVTYIKLFSKLCITLREYKRAYRFITDNIQNDNITREERNQLRQWQENIKYAMKEERAVELIYGGLDIDEVMKQTGIAEVYALKIRNGKLRQNQYSGDLEAPDNKGDGK